MQKPNSFTNCMKILASILLGLWKWDLHIVCAYKICILEKHIFVFYFLLVTHSFLYHKKKLGMREYFIFLACTYII